MRPSVGSAPQIALLTTVFVLIAACAPQRAGESSTALIRQGSQPAAASGGSALADDSTAFQAAGSGDQVQDKTLVIGIAAEVRGFSPLNNLQNKYVEDLVLGNLFIQNEQGRWSPAIAAEHPSLENGTWKIFGDGTQETLYRIRPGVKWHDGVEFTVHDLVFFWTIGRDPDIPWTHDRVHTIKQMEPLDDYTLRATWSIWEAEADAIDLRLMWPLPRHILEGAYTTDKHRFINHPYWTTDFVGLGPYKLARFVPGSHLELVANDDYVLGRPKIKNVVVRFYQDANVLIAALLSGDAHMTLHGATSEGGLSMADGIVLGTRWSGTREGKVLFNPYRIATIAIQSNPDLSRPASLGDVRVRQALFHTIDRQTLVEERFHGFTSVAEAWVPQDDPDYAMMAEGLPRYPFDPAAAQRLLAEAGWTQGADGMLASASGGKLELEIRADGTDAERTATAIGDYWKRAGIDTSLVFIPRARTSDHEWMARFPGVRTHFMVAAPVGGAASRFQCQRVPTERNNWINHTSNPAGYCSAEMQRWTDALESAYPFPARMEPFREMMRIALRDLPYLPLYFESEAVAVRANVGGINRVPPKNRGRIGMHAHLWAFV
jgi:peptide/nickel transport system substrate-binding protein